MGEDLRRDPRLDPAKHAERSEGGERAETAESAESAESAEGGESADDAGSDAGGEAASDAEGGDGAGLGLGAGLISAAYIGSAYSGHNAATRCEVERKKFTAWQRGDKRERRAAVEAVAERGGAKLTPPAAGAIPAKGPVDPFADDDDTATGEPDGETPDTEKPAPTPSPRPPARDDPWRDFWKEVRP